VITALAGFMPFNDLERFCRTNYNEFKKFKWRKFQKFLARAYDLANEDSRVEENLPIFNGEIQDMFTNRRSCSIDFPFASIKQLMTYETNKLDFYLLESEDLLHIGSSLSLGRFPYMWKEYVSSEVWQTLVYKDGSLSKYTRFLNLS
jgi:hypothetical protein